jgi:hypothetical protein
MWRWAIMIKTIRELLRARPFRPFRIVVTEGDRYDVVHRFLVAIGKSQLFYCHPRSDRVSQIRLNQIVSADLLTYGNGRQKRRM